MIHTDDNISPTSTRAKVGTIKPMVRGFLWAILIGVLLGVLQFPLMLLLDALHIRLESSHELVQDPNVGPVIQTVYVPVHFWLELILAVSLPVWLTQQAGKWVIAVSVLTSLLSFWLSTHLSGFFYLWLFELFGIHV